MRARGRASMRSALGTAVLAVVVCCGWGATASAQPLAPAPIRPWLKQLRDAGALDPAKPLWESTEILKREVLSEPNASLHQTALNEINRGAFFSTPQARTDFLVRLRAAAEGISAAQLEQSGVPRAIATEVSRGIPRPWLRQLEEMAVTRHGLPRLFQTKTRQDLAAIQRKAFLGLVAANVTKSQLTNLASGQTEAISRVPVLASLKQSAPSSSVPIDQVLSETSREWLKSKPEVIQNEIRTQLVDFVRSRDAQLDQVEAEVKKRAASVEERSLEVFSLVSGIQGDIKRIGDNLKDAQKDIVEPLGRAKDAIDAEWRSVEPRLRQGQLDQTLLKYQVQAAGVFKDLTSVASLVDGAFTDRSSFDRIGGALVASGAVPSEAKTALNAMQALSNDNASFAGKAEAVLSIGALVAPNEMKAVQGLLKDVGPVLAAAGPLLALSGFGAPVALGLGTLGGGADKGPDPQVMAELGRINAKLDAIISQLARIEELMIKQHMATMRALEAMHFDVQRLLALDQRQAFEALFGSCERSLDADNKSAAAEYKTCAGNIWELLTPTGVNSRLTIYASLRAVEGRTPLDEWRRISAAQSVVFRTADKWCGTLLAGAVPIPTLSAPSPFEHSEASKALCNDVVDSEKALEPSLLGQLTERELSTARRFSKTISAEERSRANLRWRYELRLLNLGVAQQAAFSGFSSIADVSGVLFHKLELEGFKDDDTRALLTESLKNYVAVTENALRYEMAARYGSAPGSSALYSFAYLSGDPIHFNESSKIDASQGQFVQSRQGDVYCFESRMLGAERCVVPPTPRQLQDGTPKVTAAHQLLIEQRFRVLQLVEEANILNALVRQDRERLAELLTLQFLQEKEMSKVADTGRAN